MTLVGTVVIMHLAAGYVGYQVRWNARPAAADATARGDKSPSDDVPAASRGTGAVRRGLASASTATRSRSRRRLVSSLSSTALTTATAPGTPLWRPLTGSGTTGSCSMGCPALGYAAGNRPPKGTPALGRAGQRRRTPSRTATATVTGDHVAGASPSVLCEAARVGRSSKQSCVSCDVPRFRERVHNDLLCAAFAGQ